MVEACHNGRAIPGRSRSNPGDKRFHIREDFDDSACHRPAQHIARRHDRRSSVDRSGLCAATAGCRSTCSSTYGATRSSTYGAARSSTYGAARRGTYGAACCHAGADGRTGRAGIAARLAADRPPGR
jgi:hypothetical protein